MSSTAGNTERTAICAFCGRTNAEAVRLFMSAKRPDVAICSDCLASLERMMRRELDIRLSSPPAPSPTNTYPFIGLPVPFHHHLLRVIPILQTHRHGAFELTVVSLEVYSESLLLALWVHAIPTTPDEAVVQPLAWITVTLTDDQGTNYTCGQVVSRGDAHYASGHMMSTTNMGPGYYHGRVEFQFTPTLNPAAHELQVSVPELRWEYQEMDESGQPARRVWGEEEPPWTFTVQLPPRTD